MRNHCFIFDGLKLPAALDHQSCFYLMKQMWKLGWFRPRTAWVICQAQVSQYLSACFWYLKLRYMIRPFWGIAKLIKVKKQNATSMWSTPIESVVCGQGCHTPGALRLNCPTFDCLLRHTSRTIKLTVKIYKSVGFSIFTDLCNHHHYPVSEYFHYPQKKFHTHWQSLPIP